MAIRTSRFNQQKAAEANVESFRQALGPFVVAAESSRLPIVFTDAKESLNPIIFANDSFLTLTGYSREEVLARSFNFLMESGGDIEALAQIDAAFDGSASEEPEIHYRRKDGSEFWASLCVTPVRDDHGKIVQHFISLQDLTKSRVAQTRALMFIDELNHRVKNTLATVQSIVWQAFRTDSDPAMVREAIESRLFALSRSHDLLTLVRWEGVRLHDLMDTAMEPFGAANGRAERIVIDGSNLRLSPNATLALAIAFHELATNAVKYGALSDPEGSILISWQVKRRVAGDRLILRWQERGGPVVMPPAHKGFGSDVIERGLAHELGGSVDLDFRADGVVCTIDIPVPGEAAGD